jgi:hypothetical protein
MLTGKAHINQFMLRIITLAFLLLSIKYSFGQLEEEKYLNYLTAINNHIVGFQYYTVIKVKNLNTGEVREYCTLGNFLCGALHMEYQLDYDLAGMRKGDSIATAHKDRYFEFRNDSAISNISAWKYSMTELAQLEQQVNFDSLAKEIKKSGEWMLPSNDDREMVMYAHALFNRGILTGINVCETEGLVYIH